VADRTHRTFPITRTHPHVSYATWLFMRDRIDFLEAEVYRLTVDRDEWYARANYTDEERREMYMRASQGRDEQTGEWLWPDSVKTN
jgi:hypothetical protein